LCSVEVRVLVGNGNSVRSRKNRLDMVLALTHPAENFMFRFDGFRGGELTARNSLWAMDDLEFPRSQASLKIVTDLGMSNFAHSTTEPIADQSTLVYDCFALEVLVAGKG
jgi:hypothetical protein